MNNLIESLSPIERKILPYAEGSINSIIKSSGLDETSALRALKFLETKGLTKLSVKKKIIVELGINGIYYKKNHLPERKLATYLEKNNYSPLQEAQKETKLSENEFRAALGALKKANLISINNGKISLVDKSKIVRKFPEEDLLEKLPAERSSLSKDEETILQNLNGRKDIIRITEEKEILSEITDEGRKTIPKLGKTEDLAEEVTSEMIKSGTRKKFRRYDLAAQMPHLSGGKRHFVNNSVESMRKIWLELGFKEMTGPAIDSSFWIFDSLFTAQDHPVREMQDTFFIKDNSSLPQKKLVNAVKDAHEKGVGGSIGWQYKWSEEEAQKTALRTHTTSLSARTLASLKKEDLPAKFYAIGKCFRNETIDWSHGIEFYQTEGIVVDENVNFSHLLGYLKEFYKKMGFEKIRFRPSYFPYTEPSVEIEVYHEEKKTWLELGGAGMFRPEVTIPLFGSAIPVLAWGQGVDRIIMDIHKIKDLRELYANDLKKLREEKIWQR